MVGVKALIARVFGGKSLLKMGKEDPSLRTGIGMVEAVEQGSEGGVGSIARLAALLQEVVNRRRRPTHIPKLALTTRKVTSNELVTQASLLPYIFYL